eukprot:4056061-Pleurochrysis_carterae.AAC.3
MGTAIRFVQVRCSACMAEEDRKACTQIAPRSKGESRKRIANPVSALLISTFRRARAGPSSSLDSPFLSSDAFLSSIRRSKSRPRCAERHTRN